MITPAALVLTTLASSWVPPESVSAPLCPSGNHWPYDEYPDADSAMRIAVSGTADIQIDGQPVTMEALTRHLQVQSRLPRPPATILEFGPQADCAFVQRLRDAISSMMPCIRGLCVELQDVVESKVAALQSAEEIGVEMRREALEAEAEPSPK